MGDEVRVHFHPPGPWKSFCEGVVSRVDVPTPEGRFFVLEVRNEVILDQPSPDQARFPRFRSRMSARMTSLAGSSLSRPQNRTWRGTPRLIQYWENLQKCRSVRRTNTVRVTWMSTRHLRPKYPRNQLGTGSGRC